MTYVDNFSFEWKKHNRTQVIDIEDAIKTFFEKTELSVDEIKGKRVLDAGCGAGRFTQVVAMMGAKEVVGVDLSESVIAAQENTKQFKNVRIVRGDLTDLHDVGMFDVIFSIGVLHHTPNTKQAFDSLYRLLKPGGIMAIWVYSNEGWKARAFNFVSGIHRLYTTKMNKDLLYSICKLAAPIYYLHRIPIIGLFTIALFPSSLHPKAEWRVLDTFDWYSPKYQWKHSYKEVVGWFIGFKDVRKLSFPVAVRGIK